jgi:hypothetical protein
MYFLNWILFAFFLLAGTGALHTSFISACFLILIALLFCPPFVRYIKEKYFFEITLGKKLLFTLLLLVAYSVSLPDSGEITQKPIAQDKVSKPSDLVPSSTGAKKNDDNNEKKELSKLEKSAEVQSDREEKKFKWFYSEDIDLARNKKVYYSLLESENEQDFDFPYSGGSKLVLQIRKHAEWGTDVVFKITKGQFTCGIDDCFGLINFDGKPERLTLSEPSDHSSDVLFAKYGSAILNKIKSSKKVIVELPFYQEGNRQFIFESAGLEWNR